ncbi:hypothetical protein B0H34DRAFT_801749 [Crassisporium funariophilum]|nr:hypothetical protein B0H34DRAFT_801749 [Crassisporium funariophilum]
MSLSQQLESLSIFSHLAAAMYGVACLTGALYADAQAIVKNIFITVAWLQVIDRTLDFYILMEGTDRLENLFCQCCTQDHSQNFDIKQLAQKLSLNLQGAIGIDRINPKSWEGNTCVGNVDISKDWKSGWKKALIIMNESFGPTFAPDLVKIFSQPKHDILRPMGDYVGIKETADDARSEEEGLPIPVPEGQAPEDLDNGMTSPQNVAANMQTTTTNIPLRPNDAPLTAEIDEDNEAFENLATIVAFAAEIDTDNADLIFEDSHRLDDAGIDLDDLFPRTKGDSNEDPEPEIFSHKLMDGDKEYLKSALVSALQPDQWKRLAVRPF